MLFIYYRGFLMKFKTIFFLFNGFIIMAFLLLSLIPLIAFGPEYSQMAWGRNWIITVLFVVFISGLDLYFILNWKLFNLLEKEDWPLLVAYLEERVYKKKRYSKKNLGLLINAYISVSNLDKIKRLETEMRAGAPKIVPYFALYLGTPYILENDLKKCASFFEEFINIPEVRFGEWIRWCYAFSLVSLDKLEESRDLFMGLLNTSKNDIIILLTLYLIKSMDKVLTDEEKQQCLEKSHLFTEKHHTNKDWEKVYSRAMEENLLVLLLSSLIKSSYDWINEVKGNIFP